MLRNNLAYTSISIHAPRTGSDRAGKQSRLPCWYFNPRSPHGERQSVTHAEPITHAISIHAPRTGSDSLSLLARDSSGDFNPRSPHGERRNSPFVCFRFSTFQSTLPARGATRRAADLSTGKRISIHAPRTGSDFSTPEGVAPLEKFQSTLPARGATASKSSRAMRPENFNPRSPHGERPRVLYTVTPSGSFQSTLPARGATLYP